MDSEPHQKFEHRSAISSDSHEAFFTELSRQAAAMSGTPFWFGGNTHANRTPSSDRRSTSTVRSTPSPGSTVGTGAVPNNSNDHKSFNTMNDVFDNLMMIDALLNTSNSPGPTSLDQRPPHRPSRLSHSGSKGRVHSGSFDKLASSNSTGSQISDPERSKKRGEKDKAYDYLQRLVQLRKYVKTRLTPVEYAVYTETVDNWMQQNLELMLPLDYKDLCFAEETVDRKVKSVEEFFALVNLPGLCWRRVGDILTASDPMCRLFDMTKTEFRNQNIVEMVHRDDLLDLIQHTFIKLHLYFQPTQVVRDVRLVNPKTQAYTRFRGSFVVIRDVFHMSAIIFCVLIPYES